MKYWPKALNLSACSIFGSGGFPLTTVILLPFMSAHAMQRTFGGMYSNQAASWYRFVLSVDCKNKIKIKKRSYKKLNGILRGPQSEKISAGLLLKSVFCNLRHGANRTEIMNCADGVPRFWYDDDWLETVHYACIISETQNIRTFWQILIKIVLTFRSYLLKLLVQLIPKRDSF